MASLTATGSCLPGHTCTTAAGCAAGDVACEGKQEQVLLWPLPSASGNEASLTKTDSAPAPHLAAGPSLQQLAAGRAVGAATRGAPRHVLRKAASPRQNRAAGSGE
mmetsp:Transcript_64816/g.141206  ORF Transcript_64816/g.141206 Transcript_64816/m.141206 type:complete len:106 (+) Transcript_64816:764-1081(+)